MKELSIEEKAKRYDDEAIERARRRHDNDGLTLEQYKTIDIIFPELKESEDERIRKWIRKELESKYVVDNIVNNVMADKALAWLEKQGNLMKALQEANKKIGELVEENYYLKEQGEQDMIPLNKAIKFLDEQFVNDKDEVTGEPFINFQNYGSFKETFISYFKRKMLEKQSEHKPTDKVEPKFKIGDWVVFKNRHQSIYQVEKIEDGCYILRHTHGGTFRVCILHDESLRLWAIQDAKDGDVLCCKSGWTCIFKALDNHTNNFSSYCFMDNDKWFCNIGSECHTLDKAFIKAYNREIYPATKEQRDLLFQKMKEAGYEWDDVKKELKKIEQKPLEWSEEDENKLNRLIAYFEDRESFSAEDDLFYSNWLKSFRPQNRWKPSDEHYELEEFAKIVRGNLTGISKAVQELFEAKYLQLTGNKMYGEFKD